MLTALRLLREEANCTQPAPKVEGPSIDESTEAPWQKVQAKSRGKRARTKNSMNEQRQRQQNQRKPETPDVILVGDSITKNIVGKKLSRNHEVKSFSFPGATAEDMQYFVKPLARRKPDKIIIHVGTNNIQSDRPNQIRQKITNLVDTIKQDHPSAEVAISSIVHRKDESGLNTKIDQVNQQLETHCRGNNWGFIRHDNITEGCLNRGGLHLNRKGVFTLATNLRNYISTN